MNAQPILSVRGLTLHFERYTAQLRRGRLEVLSGINLQLQAGEILAVAGASGSGKSLLAHAILGILPPGAVLGGEIDYMGAPLSEQRLQGLRGKEIALVPQSGLYLDPLMRVGAQVGRDKAAVQSVFERYKLGASVAEMYPFQLSGGMMRRVLCATAVVGDAKLIIADEPTPGMSRELATRAMKHFRDLASAGAAVMLITHDIELGVDYADRVAVLYAGRTLETARASDFEREELLRHPYTKALWRALPRGGFSPTPGSQPNPGEITQGCPFAPRCDLGDKTCLQGVIEPRTVREGEVCCRHAT